MVDEAAIVEKLKKKFDEYRFNHCLGVAKVAEELAGKEGLPINKARIAGLLHDYAKDLGEKELINLAKKSSWEIDADELALPELLHAPVGACLARQEWGIDDKEILEAIRFHTIGNPGMGKLAQIIFIADYIEPNRKFSGIEDIRAKVNKGIIPGIIAICNHSIKYNIDRNRIIHPNTLLLRNAFLGRIIINAEII